MRVGTWNTFFRHPEVFFLTIAKVRQFSYLYMVYLEGRFRSLLASRTSLEIFSAYFINSLMFRKGFLLFLSFLETSFFVFTYCLGWTGPKRGSLYEGSVDRLDDTGMRKTSGNFLVIFGLGW